MNRRSFLGLSTALGASLFTPFLRQAWAGGGAPRRFVFLVEGNGVEPTNLMTPGVRAAIEAQAIQAPGTRRYFPHLYGHDTPLLLTEDLSTAPSLDPLGPAAGADLTGLSSVVLGLSSTITGSGHTTNFGALSCTRSTPSRAGGPTIDGVLAAQAAVRGTAPFDAVRLGVHSLSTSMNTSTCAYGAGQAAPVVIDPVQAFANLFGVVGDPASQAAFSRRGRLLDYAMADVNATLGQFSGNSAERAKLEAYLTSLQTVKDRQQDLTALAPSLSGVAPTPPSASGLYTSADPFDRLQAHVDLVQAALIGGLTNLAVLSVGAGGGFDLAYPSLIADIRRHDLHHMDPAIVDPAIAVGVIRDATREVVAKAAGLARALQAVPEDGGTMLDNTLIVVMSGNGEQHHSSAEEWPFLLLGGQAMGFAWDSSTTAAPRCSQACATPPTARSPTCSTPSATPQGSR
jgi:hypothetical protein